MALIALGINHNTAPVEVREAVSFAPETMQDALGDLCSSLGVQEAAILSTCNRTEIYIDLAVADASVLLDWLSRYHRASVASLTSCHYAFAGPDAVRHMMRVASGLDSLVLGEPQILGQMKSAYAVASQFGSLGPSLYTTFHKVFSVAKRVRSETAIGENPVSVAYAAVTLAQQIFSNLKKDTALLIGAGETIELVARHLAEQGLRKMIVANRTIDNALALASRFNGEAILLAEIPEHLHRADIVISSTASQLPLLGKGAVESALKRRKHKPMFMVDIAVPRDIEAEVGQLGDVYLYTVDDLREVIDENMRSREQAAEIAAGIIDEGVAHFERERRSQSAVTTVKAFRQAIEQLRDAEVARALRQMQAGAAPEEVVMQLARNLSNKIMHKPTHQLKRASVEGEPELIAAMQQLFELEPEAEPEGDAEPVVEAEAADEIKAEPDADAQVPSPSLIKQV